MAEAAGDPWFGVNPIDAQFNQDPYPGLKRLRETRPVCRAPNGVWLLSRYRDVTRLLEQLPVGTRHTDGSLPEEAFSPTGRIEFMLQQDPPNHTRLRRLVSKAFTPRAVEAMRTQVQASVDALLDAAAAKGEMDVIADLALPVPSRVICEMMGVPLADRARFTEWTAQTTHLLAASLIGPEVIERGLAAVMALNQYFEELIAERRSNLTDDILSSLIRAEEAGDRLSPSELVAQCVGLLIAGFETTIGLIGNGVRQLLQHPDELARLRQQPALITTAVEECLRFDGPILLTGRFLHADAEIDGQHMEKDSEVWAYLSAANRDPEKFADPERFDISRKPNDHLAFGGGPHFCLGAFLARMETQEAIGRLVQRFPKMKLQSTDFELGASLFRVLKQLPVRLG